MANINIYIIYPFIRIKYTIIDNMHKIQYHLGFHMSTHAEKETRYIQYG